MLQPRRAPKRKRVGLACNTCRRQKIRCDGVRPHCGTCGRRRDRCVYPDDNNADSSRQLENSEHTTVESSGFSLGQFDAPASRLVTDDVGDGRDDSGVTAMGLVFRPREDDRHQSKEFFGDSSTFAFINQLQATLGSSSTTSNSTQQRRSPYARPSLHDDLADTLPPRLLADHLVDCYFSKVHILYPFIHKEAFLAAYDSLWTSQPAKSRLRSSQGLGLGDEEISHQTFSFGLNVVFAVGCHFSTLVQTQRESTAEAFFRLCKPALDMDSLEGGDLALNQTILLMAHYLQASRTPNRCWHVIGIACRVAQSLGLHMDFGNERRSFAEVQMRRRVWHGCVMLDLAVSSMLGRPAMISQAPVTPFPEPIDDCYLTVEESVCHQPPGSLSRVTWFIETLKLYSILRKVLSGLYDNIGSREQEMSREQRRENNLRIQSIIEIDSDLQEFKADLPMALNWDIQSTEDISTRFRREQLLLKARYSHVKVLLYRPILSQFLRDTRISQETPRDLTMHHDGIYSKFHLDCAACGVLAAVDLASIINETCRTELSSVWFYNVFYSFTAGSVLLLADLSPVIVDFVTRDILDKGWDHCQNSLSYISLYSPTAGRCAETLSLIKTKCSKGMNVSEQPQVSGNQPLNVNAQGPESPGALSNSTLHMPLGDDLFRDLDFNEDTFFDPFWFNLNL